jgi:metal-dependent amidase/aminoacylase/carboxypeptidase family protein
MLNNQQIDKLINIRREIHAHPEVAENEYQTQRRIIEFLKVNTNAHAGLFHKKIVKRKRLLYH